MQRFEIEILEQGWLKSSSVERDLCSHGRVRLAIGGLAISDGEESVGISESALALLRTLEADHGSTRRVAERLIYHGCGAILMMGCPIGIDWSVQHGDGFAEIGDVVVYPTTNENSGRHLSGLCVRIPEREYREEVLRFAEQAKSLFVGVAKIFVDETDAADYRRFWTEFDSIVERQRAI